MKVGILGSGDVAKALGGGFLKHGHDVTMGTRSPAKLADWAKQHSKARIGSFADAAKFAELGVLAVKGTGAVNLAGKPVIDATNPIADAAPVNGVLRFYTTLDESQMERLQREFPDVRFVKAFNSVGNACMVNPRFTGGKPTMFICGNDDAAKGIVSGILDQFGWETADMGKAEAARAIEPLCMLWCIPGFLRNDWSHAFKLLAWPGIPEQWDLDNKIGAREQLPPRGRLSNNAGTFPATTRRADADPCCRYWMFPRNRGLLFRRAGSRIPSWSRRIYTARADIGQTCSSPLLPATSQLSATLSGASSGPETMPARRPLRRSSPHYSSRRRQSVYRSTLRRAFAKRD